MIVYLRYFFTILAIIILSACGDVPSSKKTAAMIYAVSFTHQADVAQGAYTQVAITVKDGSLNAALTASTSDKYSIAPTPDTLEKFKIDETCENITVNETCYLKISPKSADNRNPTFDFKVLLPDGATEDHQISTQILAPLNSGGAQAYVSQESSPQHISIVNTSTNNTLYFDNEPIFVPDNGTDEITIQNNTCQATLNPGEACTFDLYSDKPVSGDIKLDDDLPAIFSVEFSPVAVLVEIIEDLPKDSAIGKSYPFVFSVVNSNKEYSATGIEFENMFPEGVTIDLTNSTCESITVLPPQSNCTWKGEFKPTTIGDKKIIINLSYNEGDKVTVESISTVTRVVVSGKKLIAIEANIALGVSYPFAYEFTNTSEQFSATGINFASTDNIEGLIVDSKNSTCPRECRHKTLHHKAKHLICTAAKKESVRLA